MIPRRRKIVVLKRYLVYPFDAIALRVSLAWLSVRGWDAVVCDRYTFDKLVNLPKPDGALSTIVRLLAPSPDLALFLDVDPETARARREEHDPSYYELKYTCYRTLTNLRWGLEAIEITTVEATQHRIEQRIRDLPGKIGEMGAKT